MLAPCGTGSRATRHAEYTAQGAKLPILLETAASVNLPVVAKYRHLRAAWQSLGASSSLGSLMLMSPRSIIWVGALLPALAEMPTAMQSFPAEAFTGFPPADSEIPFLRNVAEPML